MRDAGGWKRKGFRLRVSENGWQMTEEDEKRWQIGKVRRSEMVCIAHRTKRIAKKADLTGTIDLINSINPINNIYILDNSGIFLCQISFKQAKLPSAGVPR